jgi:hypothetical protein
MTSLTLKDLYPSDSLIQQGFKYRLAKGNLLEELANVNNRDDIVKLVERGLTKSYVASQAKQGHGKYLLYNIMDRAGRVWLANYFSGLDSNGLADLARERYITVNAVKSYLNISDDPNDHWYVIASLRRGDDPIVSFYMFLAIYGLACDTETVSTYVKHVGPEYFLRDDVKKISELFIQKFGDQDPISIILARAIRPKHKIIIENGQVKQFVNQLGGIYTFGNKITYKGPIRQAYKTDAGNILFETNYGNFINGYLLQEVHGDFILEDGVVYDLEGELPEAMQVGRTYPIPGLDLYLLVFDLKQQGLGNVVGIPDALYQTVIRVKDYHIWHDRIIINYANGTTYNLGSNKPTTYRHLPDETIGSNGTESIYIYEMGFDYIVNFERYDLSNRKVYRITYDNITIEFSGYGTDIIFQ